MADENWAFEADEQERLTVNVTPKLNVDPVFEATKNTAALLFDDGDKEERELTKAEKSLMQKHIRDQLVVVNQELEIQQKDPKSPLYSVKRFEELNLHENLLKGIYDMGFNQPSRIQETALPMLLANPPSNMIAQSQSGTGKTAAFALTLLSRIDFTQSYPQCLCLQPTYELALQTGICIGRMGKHIENLKIGYAIRNNKVSRGSQIDTHIIIGTPGTMITWCFKQKVVDMSKIKVFVLDEADVLIDTQGFKDMSIKMHHALPDDCQRLLFSATYDETVMSFARRVIKEPNVIRLRKEEQTVDTIRQYYVECKDQETKYDALAGLFGCLSVGQAIIFCHTRKTAAWLAQRMNNDKYVVLLLSGELELLQRADMLKRFKDGKERWLVTTNVCSRGIDVEQVTLVINFDLPVDHVTGEADCETYLHRIGRTGRFGRSGVAVNFVTPRTRHIVDSIESHFETKIMRLNDTTDVEEMNEKLIDE